MTPEERQRIDDIRSAVEAALYPIADVDVPQIAGDMAWLLDLVERQERLWMRVAPGVRTWLESEDARAQMAVEP